jgi:GNAT superfamily N-acetyltransferase
MNAPAFEIRPLDDEDSREWAAAYFREHWGSNRVVSRGVIYKGDRLPGFIAYRAGERIGVATYLIKGGSCEIVTLDSLVEGIGVGAALINAVRQGALAVGCTRLWLITTNDNLHALGFYQKRGFHIAAIHVNAIEQSRKLKPEIPLIGHDGIPIRDEIELAMGLTSLDSSAK